MANLTVPNSFLRRIYYQHGLYAFLLCFLPLIPGFNEAHVKTYLTLFNHPKQELANLEDAVTLMFGQRGLKTLRLYLQDHPRVILPDHFLGLIYKANEPQPALKLLSRMFFDPVQRSFPLSDYYRAIIIKHLPNIFTIYPEESMQSWRSSLVQKTASLIEIEQALPPKTAALDTAYTLLNSSSLTEKVREQFYLDAQMESLSARIKAELAGQATAATINLDLFPPAEDIPPHVLQTEDIIALLDIILHLAQSTAPEIHRQAQNLLPRLSTLDLSLS